MCLSVCVCVTPLTDRISINLSAASEFLEESQTRVRESVRMSQRRVRREKTGFCLVSIAATCGHVCVGVFERDRERKVWIIKHTDMGAHSL